MFVQLSEIFLLLCGLWADQNFCSWFTDSFIFSFLRAPRECSSFYDSKDFFFRFHSFSCAAFSFFGAKIGMRFSLLLFRGTFSSCPALKEIKFALIWNRRRYIWSERFFLLVASAGTAIMQSEKSDDKPALSKLLNEIIGIETWQWRTKFFVRFLMNFIVRDSFSSFFCPWAKFLITPFIFDPRKLFLSQNAPTFFIIVSSFFVPLSLFTVTTKINEKCNILPIATDSISL